LLHGAITLGLLGAVADDEAVAHGAVIDDHLLDPEVCCDGVESTRPGQGGSHLGGLPAQLLAEDVVTAGTLQGAAVRGRGKVPIGHRDHPAQLPGAQVVADLADQRGVVGVAALVARWPPGTHTNPRSPILSKDFKHESSTIPWRFRAPRSGSWDRLDQPAVGHRSMRIERTHPTHVDRLAHGLRKPTQRVCRGRRCDPHCRSV